MHCVVFTHDRNNVDNLTRFIAYRLWFCLNAVLAVYAANGRAKGFQNNVSIIIIMNKLHQISSAYQCHILPKNTLK